MPQNNPDQQSVFIIPQSNPHQKIYVYLGLQTFL